MHTMNDVLIVIRIATHEFDNAGIEGYFMGVREAITSVPGFKGAGMWRTMGNPEETLILYRYDSIESAQNGLKTASERVTVAESARSSMGTADARRFNVAYSDGVFTDNLEVTPFISLSIRISEPGYGSELQLEIEDIFGGLAFIPGFSGGMIGIHDSIAEELVSIAGWKTGGAYLNSLPERMPYEVKFYQRVL